MTATKHVFESLEAPGLYFAGRSPEGIFLTHEPEAAESVTPGEPTPRGFKPVRVTYELKAA